MATDNPAAIPTPESEPLCFQTLLYRLRSVMHRLKVSADSFEDFAEDTPEKYVSAAFVIQELPPELDRLYDEFDYWHAVNIERPARKAEAAAQAQAEATKEVQS